MPMPPTYNPPSYTISPYPPNSSPRKPKKPPDDSLNAILCRALNALNTLTAQTTDDPLHSCPPSALLILTTYPAALLKLAHSKIHSYPYSEVPTCWRRLYTDASIREAIRVIRRDVDGGRNVERGGLNGINASMNGTEDQDRAGGQKRGSGGGGWGDEKEEEKEKEKDWVQEAVRLLDMAVIIAGAPRREEMVEEILGALQNYVEEQELDPGPPGKKRRRGEEDGTFPMTEGKNVPEICKPIPTVSNMSMASFEKHLKTSSPLVIRDALTHWPALHERPWKSPDYLLKRTFGGRRLIPVEIGRSYTDEGWGQKIVTFREFMDGCLLHDLPDEPDGQAAPSSSMGYLAQHDLFNQIPSLRNDISIPDYCYTDPPPPSPGTPLASKPPLLKLDEPILNAWFGPAGTVSPLHTDPYHNVLCQVVGKKCVRLYAPTESEKVYPKGVEGGGIDMSNTSEVDVEDVDPVRFPSFEKAEYVECILKAGECLYIPVGWWHYVRSLTVSFSVSFWWN